MTSPVLVASSEDTAGDTFQVRYSIDERYPKESRCYIEIQNAHDLSLNPAMLRVLIDHLTSIWQELTRDRS